MGDYYYSKSYLLTVLGAGPKSICHGAAGYLAKDFVHDKSDQIPIIFL